MPYQLANCYHAKKADVTQPSGSGLQGLVDTLLPIPLEINFTSLQPNYEIQSCSVPFKKDPIDGDDPTKKDRPREHPDYIGPPVTDDTLDDKIKTPSIPPYQIPPKTPPTDRPRI